MTNREAERLVKRLFKTEGVERAEVMVSENNNNRGRSSYCVSVQYNDGRPSGIIYENPKNDEDYELAAKEYYAKEAEGLAVLDAEALAKAEKEGYY